MDYSYYTLLIRDQSTSPWTIEFGDYDRDVVETERDEYIDYAYATKVVRTGDGQADIDQHVAQLNAAL